MLNWFYKWLAARMVEKRLKTLVRGRAHQVQSGLAAHRYGYKIGR